MSSGSDSATAPLLDLPDDEANAVEIALLDLGGIIVQTNVAWDQFCRCHDGDLQRAGVGSSYLDACEAGGDDPAATAVAAAIRLALSGGLPAPLSILVPCDSPTETRVYDTLISSRFDGFGACVGATVTLTRSIIADPLLPAPVQPAMNGSTGWAPNPLPALLRVAEIVPDEVGLDQTLRRLAQSAREMLGISHAAVGLSGPDSALDQLGHSGIEALTLQQLSTPAAVVEWLEGQPESLSRDVALKGRQLATVHIAGAVAQCTSRVERLLDDFAEAAGTAIDNARAYQDARRGHQWAEAAAELTHELASHNGAAPLDIVLARVARVADADLAVVLVPHDSKHVRLQAILGAREGIAPGKLFERETSAAADVMQTGKPLLLERRPSQIDDVSDRPMGPVAVVPLPSKQSGLGALVVSRVRDRPAFTAADVEALSRFSNHAGIAIELDQAVIDREQLQLHDDRARIAHELHDNVVRQLFAVGMGLEGIIESLPDAELRGRVASYVTALDESIRGIRESIYRTGSG